MLLSGLSFEGFIRFLSRRNEEKVKFSISESTTELSGEFSLGKSLLDSYMHWICDNFIVQFMAMSMNKVTADESPQPDDETSWDDILPSDVHAGHVFAQIGTFLFTVAKARVEKRAEIFSISYFRLFMYVRWIADEKFYCITFFHSRSRNEKKKSKKWSRRPLHNNFAWYLRI